MISDQSLPLAEFGIHSLGLDWMPEAQMAGWGLADRLESADEPDSTLHDRLTAGYVVRSSVHYSHTLHDGINTSRLSATDCSVTVQ